MKWIEQFSYQSRLGNNCSVAESNKAHAIEIIEEKLNGKVISTREVEKSRTADADYNYCEALVEL